MHIIEPLPDIPGVPKLNRFAAIDPATTALLVIDLQNCFLQDGYPAFVPHALDVVAPINILADALRSAGATVIYTRHTVVDEPPRAPPAWQRDDPALAPLFDPMRRGTESHALHASVAHDADDLVIDKHRFSAFLPVSSDIDAQLKARGIDTVIITGTLSNICCESSARDAHMLGYRVFFPADANAALTDADHNATLRSMDACFADVRPSGEIIAMIDLAA